MLWILGVWTALGVLWRIVGVLLVAAARRPPAVAAGRDERPLTIFKPLPGPLDETERHRLQECLESFAADRDDASQLLIGCHQADREFFAAFVERMSERYPVGSITLVANDDPSRLLANPKVSWCRILEPHATGDLWFWSDADIVAPPGTVASLRSDIARRGVGLVTSPYVIRDAVEAPELLDQLFVNAEFYPGALLTGRLGLMRFAFGSGMLFEADRFRRLVAWDEIGSRLADDHYLGHTLQPVHLGSMTVKTHPASRGWVGSLSHYFRWHKTIRWVQPAAYAAQLVVLPVIGWLAWTVAQPSTLWAWGGLLTLMGFEAVAAAISCRLVGARIGPARLVQLLGWPLLRAFTTLACWLPWPIDWRGEKWWGPSKASKNSTETVGEHSGAGAQQ
jgi:ceramide glucosyltransferase